MQRAAGTPGCMSGPWSGSAGKEASSGVAGRWPGQQDRCLRRWGRSACAACAAGLAAQQHMPHTYRLREQTGQLDAIFALDEQPQHVGMPTGESACAMGAAASERLTCAQTRPAQLSATLTPCLCVQRWWAACASGLMPRWRPSRRAVPPVRRCRGLPPLNRPALQAGAGGELDAAYRALSRARDQAAAKKTRTMQVRCSRERRALRARVQRWRAVHSARRRPQGA